MAVNVGSAVGYLDLDTTKFLAGLKTAQREADSTSKNIASNIGANLQSAGKSMTSAGMSLIKSVTTPIVGIGTAIVKVSSNFESAMSKVSAISGATGKDLDMLNKKAQEMGIKTKFSATEAAEAFTYMAMAGWKTEDMLSGIDGIMNLAAADGLDLATTSDIVTDALTAFGLSAKDSGHFADVLAKASSNANTNVSMLGESFKYAAPVAGALGYSVEDTAKALGLMANAGIKGAQGGTALRGALTRMISPSKEASKYMEKYGISMTNTDGSMKSLGEVMDMLRSKLGNLTEAEKAQFAAEVFGQQSMSGMLSIIDAADDDYEKLTDAIYNADGAAKQMAQTMLNNLKGQFVLLKSALEGVALQFGEILLPILKDVVKWLQDLTQKLQQMSPEQKKQIVRWAGIAAAIGPVLLVIGKVVSLIGKLVSAFGFLSNLLVSLKGAFATIGTIIGGLSLPFVALVAAVVAVIAAFVKLWKTNEDFRNKIIAIWNGVKEKLKEFSQGISDLLDYLGFSFEDFVKTVKAIWNGFCDILAPIFVAAFKQISIYLETALDIILGILDVFAGIIKGDWSKIWEGISKIFSSIWKGIKSSFDATLELIKGIWDVVLSWFGTTWEKLWTNIKQFFIDIWNGIVDFFSSAVNSITESITNFVTTVVDFFVQLPQNIANLITEVYNAVSLWVSNMILKAVELGSNFLTTVINFFKELPYNIGYFIGYALTTVAIWVGNMITKAIELGTNFINNVVTFFSQLPGRVLEFITNTFNNVVSWASDMVKKAAEMGSEFINNVVTFFSQLPGKVFEFVSDALGKVSNWASDMASKAIEAGSEFISNVTSYVRRLPGRIKESLDNAIGKLTSWVTDMGNKGVEAVNALIDGVMSAAWNIGSQVVSIGEDIVNGVWSGIKSAAGWFRDQVKGFFSGIVNGIKGALGIGSPSKVFANEIGRWLPPGVAIGFKGALPSAMRTIQTDLRKGISSLNTRGISFGANSIVTTFTRNLKSTYNGVIDWFESVESKIGNSVRGMQNSLNLLMESGQGIVNADGSIGYVGYNGFSSNNNSKSNKESKADADYNKVSKGDTFIFNSPKPINEIEAARQMKKTKREIVEGF